MAEEPTVYSITEVSTGLTTDQKSRQTRYLWSMSLRTICFVLAVIVTGPLRWVLLFGAVFLPYFAVIIANAGRERGSWGGNGAFVDDTYKNELPS
jgi:hypothetical protein